MSVISKSLQNSARQLIAVRTVTNSAPCLAGRKKMSYPAYNRELERDFDMEDLETWKHDDHTTYGHLLLENIRDVRQYMRKIKYELPTLAGKSC